MEKYIKPETGSDERNLSTGMTNVRQRRWTFRQKKIFLFFLVEVFHHFPMLYRLVQALSRSVLLNSSRTVSTTSPLYGGDYEWKDPKSEDEVVNITYVTRDGTKRKIRGKVGDNVMYLAHR